MGSTETANTRTTTTPPSKKKSADPKKVEEASKKYGADVAAVERRVKSAMKLLNDTKRTVRTLVKNPQADLESTKDAALETLEDVVSKVKRIIETVNEIGENGPREK
jgi:hypothetical protein